MESRDWGLGTRGWGFGIIMAIVVAGLSGFAKESAESNPGKNLTIALHVYDYAQVEEKDLARARDEVSRVLQRIGIEAAWLNCPVPGMERQNAQECRSTAGALVLRILPRAMAERAGRDKGSLGFAQLADDGAPTYEASVFYHLVASRAVELRCARGVILGYTLAHEIGHLLLGTNSHAPDGIMRAHWTEEELRLASAGRVSFFPQQGAKMRAEVAARAQLAAQKQPESASLSASVK